MAGDVSRQQRLHIERVLLEGGARSSRLENKSARPGGRPGNEAKLLLEEHN